MASSTVMNKWCSDIKYAVEINDKQTIEYLLRDASDAVEYKNPLLLALLVDYAPIIHTVIRSITQVGGITNEKLARILVEARCPITQIITICNIEVIELMIKRGADLNYREKQFGLSAMHMAAHSGDLQLVDLLLLYRADINIKCQGGETPLHKAVNTGNFYMVQRLLYHGADVNSHDNSELTPLHCAFHSLVQRNKMIWLLINNGAKLTATDVYGITPLHLACDFPEVIEYLLNNGIDPNLKEFHKGKTVLHCIMERVACNQMKRHIESINILLRHDVDINDTNNEGCTPLHCAFERLKFAGVDNVFSMKQILCLCFEHGADINAKNVRGETVLKIAAQGYRIWAETILEYIAKFESQRLPIDDCNFDIIKNDRYFNNYYSICKMELLALKKQKCYGKVSFFNLLTDNLKKMMDYARNHDLMESFVNSCYYKRFPIYCTHLSDRINRAVEKQKLMYNTAKFLSSTLKFISPYDVIMEKILYYLSESDMRKIVGK